MGAADQKLGRTTIMDRALAQKYGAAYVHLAAFAIDIDRVQHASEDDPSLPFGWDVVLTDLYVCTFVAPRPEAASLLDDVVLSVLDQTQAERRGSVLLGSQLPFAIFTALERGDLPHPLHACFGGWKRPPLDLSRDVSRLRQDRQLVARLCARCVEVAIQPPLVEPVRVALAALGAG